MDMLSNHMRLLWSQHVYWTRLFLSGTIFSSPDVKCTEERLLRNPKDFAAVFCSFYGPEIAAEFEDLFTKHLVIAAELVTAILAGNAEAAEDAERCWYENADMIACFLARINPCWSEKAWREMMHCHLKMTKQEAADFISKDFVCGICIFECIEKQAMEMADMMTRGLLKQFPQFFC